MSSSSLHSRQRSTSSEGSYIHSFETTTYLKPTYCDLCSQFIWGVVAQGVSCTHCQFNCHYKCKAYVKAKCNELHSPSSAYSFRNNSSSEVASLTPPDSPQLDMVRNLYNATQEGICD